MTQVWTDGKTLYKTNPVDIIGARVHNEALFYLQEGQTIRSTAKEFGVSKSTVYYDLTQRLYTVVSHDIYSLVTNKLSLNAADAPYRGGEATQRKKGKNDADN